MDVFNRIDPDQFKQVLDSNDAKRVQSLWDFLHATKHSLERQLQSVDEDSRGRMIVRLRDCDRWIVQSKRRLHEIQQPERLHAVVIQRAGLTAQAAANALNAMLERGCYIGATLVIDGDLVVLARSKKS